MALPLATRLAPTQAAPFSNLSNPAAVAAAQRVLQETGDSAEAAVAAAKQYSGVTLNYLSEAGLMAEGPKVFSGPKWTELTGINVTVVDKPFPELFPTSLRSTGTSFCYNVGRFLAASGPWTIGLLSSRVFGNTEEPLRYAGLAMCSVFVVGLLALPFAPETKGQPLPED